MTKVDINNRFTYHAPTGAQPEQYDHIRSLARGVAHELHDLLPEGREKSLASTHLEEVVFWANASIARS